MAGSGGSLRNSESASQLGYLFGFNLDSCAAEQQKQGDVKNVNPLGLFASIGLLRKNGSEKPALAEWDSYRK
jgi:hypothetical protein